MSGGVMQNDSPMGIYFFPGDAAQIDQKIDDGLPLTGMVVSGNGCTTASFVCPISCIDSSGKNAFINLGSTAASCFIAFFLNETS